MKIYIILLTMLLLVFCGGQEGQVHDEGETPTPAGPGAEEHEGEEHQDVQVSLEKQKSWGIKVGSAVMENIVSSISLPGVLVMNQNKTAQISSFVAGKVIALAADLGTKVRKGQSLCTINSPQFANAQADFLETRARLNLSQKNFERAQKLFKEKALEEKEFLRREAEYEKLITEYGARGSTLHSYGLTHKHIDALISKCDTIKLEDEEYMCEIADPKLPILSPLGGTIVFRDVLLGENVDPEKTVFMVSNLNTLWALLDAYEKDLPFISKNSTVFIESPLYPGKKFKGEIIYISDLIDEQLRTVKIRVAINNSEGLLKPNMYIQGTLENTSEANKTLVIPDEAVQNLEGEKIVFVLEEEDIFTVRHVSLGLKIGRLRIITEGLSAAEKLVIKGAFYLKTELTKATFGSAHVH